MADAHGEQHDEDPRKKAAEGVGIGVGLGVGGPVLAFLAVGLLDLSGNGAFAAFATGGFIATVGATGALIDFAKLRGDNSFEYVGLGVFFIGVATILFALESAEVVTGAIGTIVTVLGLVAVLFVFIGMGMGISTHVATTESDDGERSRAAMPSADAVFRPRMSRFELLSLFLALLGAAASFFGALRA